MMVGVVYFSCTGNSAQKRNDKIEKGKEQPQVQVQVPLDDKVILKINEHRFSNRDLKKYIQIRYSDVFDIKQKSKLLSRFFDFFIEHKIISSIANQENIPVTQEEYEEYLRNLKISEENIDKTSIIEAIKVEKYLYAKVYKDIEVTQAEIRQYYESHHDEFIKKKEVLLYQILLKDKEKALKISGILKNYPQQFDELARSESVSSEGKNDGLLGYFEEGTLPKEMEDVVFSLKLNEISPVIESPYGFHIFKVTRQKRSGRLLFLRNVEPEIKTKLMSEKLSKAYQEYQHELKKKLSIDIRYQDLYFNYQKN